MTDACYPLTECTESPPPPSEPPRHPETGADIVFLTVVVLALLALSAVFFWTARQVERK